MSGTIPSSRVLMYSSASTFTPLAIRIKEVFLTKKWHQRPSLWMDEQLLVLEAVARNPLPWRCHQTFKERLILEHVLLGMLCSPLSQLSSCKLEALLLLKWSEKRF